MCVCVCVYNVKWSRYRPGVAQRVGRGIALLFHGGGTRRGWVVSSTPRPHFTLGEDLVPISQEAGWAAGPVWRAKNLVPTGIRSRTVQPVVSRYTDWATRPTIYVYIYIYIYINILLSNRCTNIQFVDKIRIIIKYLKIFKIVPTCFGSQGIHHQGAILNIFKYFITNYIFVHLLDNKVF